MFRVRIVFEFIHIRIYGSKYNIPIWQPAISTAAVVAATAWTHCLCIQCCDCVLWLYQYHKGDVYATARSGMGEFISVRALVDRMNTRHTSPHWMAVFGWFAEKRCESFSFQMLVDRRPCCCVSALSYIIYTYYIILFIFCAFAQLTNSNKELINK